MIAIATDEHLCRHCQKKPGCYSRGLCANCYSDPSLRVQYPLIENQCLRRGLDNPAEVAAAREEIDRHLLSNAMAEERERVEHEAGKACVPFGPYRGVKIRDVPAEYLIWLLPFSTGPFETDLMKFFNMEIETLREKEDDDDCEYGR